MSITATTLSAAMTSTDNSLQVVSATGISAPVSTTGSGFTYLMVDNELLFVTAVNGTVISILRGQSGTQAVSHVVSTPVLIGGPSDFANFTPATSVTTNKQWQNFDPVGANQVIGASNVVTPPAAFFHTSGTEEISTITVPSGMDSGTITIVFDGSGDGLTWDAAGNIAVAGTATTAASAVSFTYDSTSGKWHPSRLA